MSEEKVQDKEVKKPEKKKMSLLKKVIIAVVAFFVIIFAYTYFATAAAVKVADEFVGYIQDAKPAEAYDLFSKQAKEVVPQDQFAELVSQISPILNGEKKIISRAISDGTSQETASKITYKIPGSDGDTYVMEVQLLKEDGEWMVLNFETFTEENYNAQKDNDD